MMPLEYTLLDLLRAAFIGGLFTWLLIVGIYSAGGPPKPPKGPDPPGPLGYE